ncbi:MAG: ATP-binding protein [Alphaproteobacteria bacterium]|nr:ATP-binding protein [Alphaproteobacteria bacterium]
MRKYRPRIADKILKEKLEGKGAVLIEGAKWCGKTTSASQIAKSILYMQDPEKVKQNLELAEIKPSKLLEGNTPRLIDEWQMAPQLWDAIRFSVDQRDAFGQFILTGSSVPADTSKVYHSGAGRITKMLMRPMSLFESEDSSGTVSLRKLFGGNLDVDGTNSIDIEMLSFLICRGGWPKSLDCSEKVALQQAFDYYSVIVDTDISKVDNVHRNKGRAHRLMRAYARFIGSQATLQSISNDLQINEAQTISDDTISSYINALKRIFVIEDSSAWNPNLRSKTAIRSSDTRYFTDPSIGVVALGLGPQDLINDLNTMGLFFENLCIRDLKIYAESLNGNVYHYRDRTGLECDAVVHLRNGLYGLIEIKLGGETRILEGIETLNKLESNIDISKMKAPSFKMVLTGTGSYAYKRPDGVLIVPIGCLRN